MDISILTDFVIYKYYINVPVQSILLTCASISAEQIFRSETARVKTYVCAIHILVAVTSFSLRGLGHLTFSKLLFQNAYLYYENESFVMCYHFLSHNFLFIYFTLFRVQKFPM